MSDDLVTGAELAELLGIHPVCIDDDLSRQPGFVAGIVEAGDLSAMDEGIPQPEQGWLITRRDLAKSWDINADTISKWLHEGLRAAIVSEGPRGMQVFDRRLADRWKTARDTDDALTLRDFVACGRRGWPALHYLFPLRVAAAVRQEVGEERFQEVMFRCLGWQPSDDEPAPTSTKRTKRRKPARKKKARR